jgi:phenylalanine-4-hydroxylase
MPVIDDPEQIAGHAAKYAAHAWNDYTEEELAWWVRLLTKRAQMRTDEAKREKDLTDAANYQSMLDAMKEVR